jgi:hypothetical protein
MSRLRSHLLQLPILITLAFMATLFLAMPYRFHADAVTFGRMGEDLYHVGYLPTVAYGQNYLFSLTPYLYAFYKAVLPSTTSWAMILMLAGTTLSIAGLWLVYGSFRITARREGGNSFVAPILFCVLLASAASYIFDLSQNASIEVSLFALGWLLFAGSKVEEDAPGQCSGRWWFATGAALSFASYSRPQVCTYGIVLVLLLLIRLRSSSRPLFWKGLGLLAAGAVIAYLPMLAHNIFRAPSWPFGLHAEPQLAGGRSIAKAMRIVIHEILPSTLDIETAHPFRSALIVLWAICAIAAYLRMAARRQALSALDHAWFGGTILIVAVMVLQKDMITDSGNRRYFLHTVLALIWLFCRFCPRGRIGTALASALAAALLLISIPAWSASLETGWVTNRLARETREKLVPELARHDAVIISDYWDAYFLSFLAEDRIQVEAAPWGLVRTYGRFTENQLRNSLWLIRCGRGRMTYDSLIDEFGAGVVDRKTDIPVTNRFCGAECELWKLPDGNLTVDLMKKWHPRYFSTHYPPGSR